MSSSLNPVRYKIIKYSKFIAFVILSLINKNTFAQPAIQKSKSFGGNGWDYVHSMQITKDGGIILAGKAESNNADVTGNHGGSDYWVVKLNKAGKIQWQKCLGGTGYEEAYSIANTLDGGYIITGVSNSNDGDVTNHHNSSTLLTLDTWVVKLNSAGNIEWQKCLGGNGDEFGQSIQQTADSGYLVASWTNSIDGDITFNHGDRDAWITKLSKRGSLEWQKSFGGTGSDIANSIELTKDGGFIAAGSSSSADGDLTGNHGDYDYWIIKANRKGNIEWQKNYGGTGFDYARDIELTKDGGYVVAGSSASNNGDATVNKGWADYWIIKLNKAGVIEWQKSYGGSFEDNAFSIQQLPDNGYMVTGGAESFNGDVLGHHGTNGNPDAWVLRLNPNGTILWQKSMGGTGADYGNAIKQTPDKGCIMASASYSTDGDVSGNHGDYDYWITKLAPDNDFISSLAEDQIIAEKDKGANKLFIYPNPATDYIIVRHPQINKNAQISFTGISGNMVKEVIATKNTSQTKILLSSLTPGIYQITWTNGTDKQNTQVVIK